MNKTVTETVTNLTETEEKKALKLDKTIATAAIIYFVIGLVFAIFFAIFYHWPTLSFFSPGFYIVILTWPFQIPGFIGDFRVFGFAGKILI